MKNVDLQLMLIMTVGIVLFFILGLIFGGIIERRKNSFEKRIIKGIESWIIGHTEHLEIIKDQLDLNIKEGNANRKELELLKRNVGEIIINALNIQLAITGKKRDQN